MHSIYSFWNALISSLCAFLTFSVLAFIGFLLLHGDSFFTLSRFLRKCESLLWNSLFGTWFGWYALCCSFHVGVDEVSIFVIRGKCSDISWRVSNSFLTVIVYLLLISLFDPSRWPMRFFRPAPGEAHRWLNVGFIRFTSHPSCCLSGLLKFYVRVKKDL